MNPNANGTENQAVIDYVATHTAATTLDLGDSVVAATVP